MVYIEEMPVTEVVNFEYSRMVKPFAFYSAILGFEAVIPTGFTHDWESAGILKGTNKVGGLIHDYLCRSDSIPTVSKKIAADVYLEFMEYFNGLKLERVEGNWLEKSLKKAELYTRAHTKYWIVRAAPGYFHKKSVLWEFGE